MIANFLWSVHETARVGVTVKADVNVFDEMWHSVLVNQGVDLKTLKGLTDGKDEGPARQLNRLFAPSHLAGNTSHAARDVRIDDDHGLGAVGCVSF